MNTDLTDLTAIRQRAEAATPGPWTAAEWFGSDEGGWAAIGPHHTTDIDDVEFADEPDGIVHARAKLDADFIAHARDDIPYLLDRIEVLEQALVTARTALRAGGEWFDHRSFPHDNTERMDICVGCGNHRYESHLPDCNRQQALTDIAGVLGAEPCKHERWVTDAVRDKQGRWDAGQMWPSAVDVFCVRCGITADKVAP